MPELRPGAVQRRDRAWAEALRALWRARRARPGASRWGVAPLRCGQPKRGSPCEPEGGPAVDCHTLRKRITDSDVRPRDPVVGAHLYACEDCRAYVKAVAARETGLAGLSPPLSPWAAVAVLESVLEKRQER